LVHGILSLTLYTLHLHLAMLTVNALQPLVQPEHFPEQCVEAVLQAEKVVGGILVVFVRHQDPLLLVREYLAS